MKNIKRKLWILAIILCGYMSFGIKAYAADGQWFTQQVEKLAKEGNVYVVSQDGTGDFLSIQEGVNAVNSGDTLIICPGIYEENVEIMAKTVNLLGVDRDSCILQYDTVNYGKVPLTVAAGQIDNITIRGYKNADKGMYLPVSAMQEEVFDEDSQELLRQSAYSGYAVHVDQNYLYGKELSFEKCRIESYNSYCMGIGSRGESTITVTECELLAAGDGGCIYLHDVGTLDVGGSSTMIFRNSMLQSSLCPYIMTIHALHTENQMYLTFQNVKVYGVAYEDNGGYSFTNMNTGLGVEPQMMHVLSNEETVAYMERNKQAVPLLQEGITYIATQKGVKEIVPKKRYVFNVYNVDGMPGDGWCGLSNTWLTSDSFGNTLQDMNAIYQPSITGQEPVLADVLLYNNHND